MVKEYGKCSGCTLELVPVWFTEKEYKVSNGTLYETGRTRRAVDYLICPQCMSKYAVDDSFDGEWH